MINFRYHLVSLVAVFLALGIGVIMGTAVIDSAVVDRLESQQKGLENDISAVRDENDRLRSELGDLRDASEQLAEEGSQRLLDGALDGQPVLVVGVRGVRPEGLDDLTSIIQTADADYQGTLWLTDRFVLDDDDERRDLAEVLGFSATSASSLRAAAVNRLSRLLRQESPEEQPAGAVDLIAGLREAGFVDVEGLEGDATPALAPGTRVVVLSGTGADVADEQLALPLVRSLVRPLSGLPAAPVLAVEATPETPDEGDTWLLPIRQDDVLSSSVSTVDNVDEFAGRLAAVLAVQDLGGPRYGHYGRGEGAQRLLPAPVE
jgi:hypothetical protein